MNPPFERKLNLTKNNTMKRILVLCICFVAVLGAKAQGVLTLEQAIGKAMESNLGIQVYQLQEEAFAKDVHAGKAGLLPKVDAVAGGNYSSSTADIQFAGGIPPLDNANATTFGYNAGVQLSFTLFDGLGSFRLYDKLKTQEDINSLQTKVNIESLLMQVISSYHDVLRNQEQVEILTAMLALSQERLTKAENNYEFGAVGKIEVLNAQVDFNNDQANLLTQQENLKAAKRQLNFLLGQSPSQELKVENEVLIVNPALEQADSIKQRVMKNNSALVLSQLNLDVAELDRKMAYSVYAPRIGLSGSYGLNYTENTASVLLKSNSLGFTGAVSLTWNLFNGNQNRKALEKSKLLIEANELKKQEAELNVEKEYLNLLGSLNASYQLIQLESSNIEAAELNLEKSKELYFNGTINNLAFRQAQVNLLMAQSRLNSLKYQFKLQEYQLKRLANRLIL